MPERYKDKSPVIQIFAFKIIKIEFQNIEIHKFTEIKFKK